MQCDDLAVEFINLLRERSSPDERITDITLAKEISRDRTELVCKGIGHRPQGNHPVKFYQDSYGGGRLERLDLEEYECEYLIPLIITFSEERSQYTTRPQVLKIYDPKELQHSDKEFTCSGMAKMSSGGDVSIEFHIEEDRDGDRFIGYRRVE